MGQSGRDRKLSFIRFQAEVGAEDMQRMAISVKNSVDEAARLIVAARTLFGRIRDHDFFDGRKRKAELYDLVSKVIEIALEKGVAHLDK
jgi:hypothetical protein